MEQLVDNEKRSTDHLSGNLDGAVPAAGRISQCKRVFGETPIVCGQSTQSLAVNGMKLAHLDLNVRIRKLTLRRFFLGIFRSPSMISDAFLVQAGRPRNTVETQGVRVRTSVRFRVLAIPGNR